MSLKRSLLRSGFFARFCALTAMLSLVTPSVAFASNSITVFAPSSMTDVLSALGKSYRAKRGTRVVVSFAGSAQLARQVAAGAPADVVISAHPDWMDYLVEQGAVDEAAVRVVAGNRLVIAVRREVENWAEPLELLRQDRFAMGEPESVPAGTYARAALRSMGLWNAVQKNAVYGENVRVALFRLVRGEVGAAIVYESDLTPEPEARVAYTFDGKANTVISYVAAPVAAAEERQRGMAIDFVSYLTGADGQAVFARFGFLPKPVTQQ